MLLDDCNYDMLFGHGHRSTDVVEAIVKDARREPTWIPSSGREYVQYNAAFLLPSHITAIAKLPNDGKFGGLL